MGNARNNRGGSARSRANRQDAVEGRAEQRQNDRQVGDVSGSGNAVGGINFAHELPNEETQVPSGDAPDPNNYRGAEDEGFVKNIVAGGAVPGSSPFTREFVNGVDHEEVDEADESEAEAEATDASVAEASADATASGSGEDNKSS